MKTKAPQLPKGKIVPSVKPKKVKKCLSCGTTQIKPRRRYCSSECRQQAMWVLSLAKGLLRTFNARYAAFSFTNKHVILDVLPIWSKGISRFMCPRTLGNKPSEDLKNLILQSGEEYYCLVNNRNSRSYASLCLLKEKHHDRIDPESIKPDRKSWPRLSKEETESLKMLKLDRNVLSSETRILKIKSAYKKMAKLHHPDMGGDEELFKRLNEAHQQMLLWSKNPQYTSRKALRDCWSYDGSTNRWSPPL